VTPLLAFLLLFITAPVQLPETVVVARVVGISDGDTIRALTNDNQLLRVRLRNIDAPEKSQAFGQASKQNLSRYIFGRDVELHVFGIDRYGRSLAIIVLQDVDINLEQVRDGFAWVYEKYIGENSPGVQGGGTKALRSKRDSTGADSGLIPTQYRLGSSGIEKTEAVI
jgi:micrococcal nuclease